MQTTVSGTLRHLSEFDRASNRFSRNSTDSRGLRRRDRDERVVRFRPIAVMMIAQNAFMRGRVDLMDREEEAAGLLLGPQDDDLITHYIPNAGRSATRTSVTLDAEHCNEVIGDYLQLGMDLKGIWHLHPSGVSSLSMPDLDYVASLFEREKNGAATKFYMPILCDGRTYPYVLSRHDPYDVQPAAVVLV